MIQDFDLWFSPANRPNTNHISDLSGCVLAIEASFYLHRLLTQHPSKEPLLSALGGVPLSLRAHINSELRILRSHDIKPIFVFSGLDVGKKHTPFQNADEVARKNAGAWDLYHQQLPERAVETFGSSGYATPERYYRFLQTVLREADVDKFVAPYSAWGQLAYIAKFSSEHADAIAGSSELLLFDVDQVITKLDFAGEKEDNPQFTFVRRQQCVEEFGNITPDMFVDACILAGSDLLPTLPPLTNRRQPKIRQVLELMKNNGQSGISVCLNYQQDAHVKREDYVDRYRRSRLAVKHQIVMSAAGKVEPFDQDGAPSDLHLVIGQRLPDELYFYLSKGTIGPRVLNSLTSGVIHESCPTDGGESDTYRTLVSEKLTPLRSTSLALLATHLHRAYIHRKIDLSCWYAPEKHTEINLNEDPSPKATVEQWVVAEENLTNSQNLQGPKQSLLAAVQALSDPSFAAKTIKKKAKKEHDPAATLKSSAEIAANSIFRFLHLRGYVDAQHNLTSWGKVLNIVLSGAPATANLEEPAFLAVELLRLGLLNSDNMFPMYTGAPMQGSETDKRNTLLLSRVASLCRLRHKEIGFTGPLSRHLLAYNSVISVVRESLRDLLEMSVATLLLSGDAVKDRGDLTDLGLYLPFLLANDCGLGIAMKHYLDELPTTNDPTDPAVRAAVKERGPKDWFAHATHFAEDLDLAFGLWDAIYAGVKVGSEAKIIKDQGKWDEVDKWVQARR